MKGIFIDSDTVESFSFVARVMEIHTRTDDTPPSVNVAEECILVTPYTLSYMTTRTQLLDASGNSITLSDLSIDDRVAVAGLKLSDGTIVGKVIQQKGEK